MKQYTGTELLRQLCAIFGPSGCESEVAQFIITQIEDVCDAYCIDRFGNLICKVCGNGIYYNAKEPKKVMVSAHMDEVGIMVSDITEDGYLKFLTVGGIDARVLCGRKMIIGDEDKRLNGVVASKAIHMQTAEERGKVTPISKMYIDIGATDEEDARKYVSVGDYGVFDSDFVEFGKDNSFLKGKAIDDRLGCAIMIENMRRLKKEQKELPYDVYFCFTCCEEIGVSGASVAAQTIAPDAAIVIESTAVADIAGVPDNAKVATIGEGGAISLMDRSTIYDRGLVDLALATAERNNLHVQIKKYVSGGNDSAHIQRSGCGTRMFAISAPSKYIHSQSCVVSKADYEYMREFLYCFIAEGKLA